MRHEALYAGATSGVLFCASYLLLCTRCVTLHLLMHRECPLAIAQFCGNVPPGNAAVIRCLQTNMGKPHFPAGCKAVMAQLTDRAQVKYSLNSRLIEACMMGESAANTSNVLRVTVSRRGCQHSFSPSKATARWQQ